jgi:hypothetical protein
MRGCRKTKRMNMSSYNDVSNLLPITSPWAVSILGLGFEEATGACSYIY